MSLSSFVRQRSSSRSPRQCNRHPRIHTPHLDTLSNVALIVQTCPGPSVRAVGRVHAGCPSDLLPLVLSPAWLACRVHAPTGLSKRQPLYPQPSSSYASSDRFHQPSYASGSTSLPASGRSSPYPNGGGAAYASSGLSSVNSMTQESPYSSRSVDDLEGQNDERLEGLMGKVRLLKDVSTTSARTQPSNPASAGHPRRTQANRLSRFAWFDPKLSDEAEGGGPRRRTRGGPWGRRSKLNIPPRPPAVRPY